MVGLKIATVTKRDQRKNEDKSIKSAISTIGSTLEYSIDLRDRLRGLFIPTIASPGIFVWGYSPEGLRDGSLQWLHFRGEAP